MARLEVSPTWSGSQLVVPQGQRGSGARSADSYISVQMRPIVLLAQDDDWLREQVLHHGERVIRRPAGHDILVKSLMLH